ncbi:hypothetical protein [Nonomuraea gerenzanensis]|uniref:Chaplin domain-containing protein n=1 Tax=Nonomuraea gerenzanensis TaxID=93944 RepID=A0A1M4EAX1_9ACTN|nr:hypothetical protein [Nonomuraea gerenzanensis]UBU18135.1 hypothetical protein LCN96_24855 [Nonomuraea gerenzanensis]SBO95944.1 hypothetical protein BN4615_P5460 [Nonomuraea gerenzanensis]
MRHSTRIATITLAGAFALAAVAGPAAATVPGGIDALNGNSVLNDNNVCVQDVEAAAIGVKVPIVSSESAGCVQR